VLFHAEIQVPFTVLIVKDRVWRNNPALSLSTYRDENSDFLENIDDKFAMVQPDAVDNSIILDVRDAPAFASGHMPGSINIPLRQLPQRWQELANRRSDDPTRPIVCVCGGGIQSAYAVMFLRSRGLHDTLNLSGGIGRWVKEGRPIAGA
jgi:rhodanese-related sulfurtransferase